MAGNVPNWQVSGICRLRQNVNGDSNSPLWFGLVTWKTCGNWNLPNPTPTTLNRCHGSALCDADDTHSKMLNTKSHRVVEETVLIYNQESQYRQEKRNT